ncbi:MAG: helix-turn-helix domain-containing protein [Steroidobacteraceae bacterium]
MRGVPIRGRGKAARATSERALLDAFEGLLQRHGPEGIGVNAVLDSARVGKQLLYRYFGDLEGLARACRVERRDPLALGRRAPRLRAAVARRSVPQRIALLMQDFATRCARTLGRAGAARGTVAAAALGAAMRRSAARSAPATRRCCSRPGRSRTPRTCS